MATEKFINYSYLPTIEDATVIINAGAGVICMITSPEVKKVTVQSTPTDFTYNHCELCKHRTTNSDVELALRVENKLPTSENIHGYLKSHNKCLGISSHLKTLGYTEGTGTDTTLSIPKAKCKADLEYNEFVEVDITTPYLLWVYTPTAQAKGRFKLYALSKKDLVQGHLKGKPYLIPNIYPTGEICWARTRAAAETPANLLGAYNDFWSSTFTASLYKKPLTTSLSNHIVIYDADNSEASYECLDHLLADAVIIKGAGINSRGVFYSAHEKFLDSEGMDQHMRSAPNGKLYVVGLVNYDMKEYAKRYLLTIGGYIYAKESNSLSSASTLKKLGHFNAFLPSYTNPDLTLKDIYADADQRDPSPSFNAPTPALPSAYGGQRPGRTLVTGAFTS